MDSLSSLLSFREFLTSSNNSPDLEAERGTRMMEGNVNKESRNSSKPPYLNIVIKQPDEEMSGERKLASSAQLNQLNVFIPGRQMSIDEVILQGRTTIVS